MEFPFPDGPLVKALLAHIKEGHLLLTDSDSFFHGRETLFVSRHGNRFSNLENFCHFWKALMGQFAKQDYFPPSTLRTTFVEEFTSVLGFEPDMWDGCAAITGSSVVR